MFKGVTELFNCSLGPDRSSDTEQNPIFFGKLLLFHKVLDLTLDSRGHLVAEQGTHQMTIFPLPTVLSHAFSDP